MTVKKKKSSTKNDNNNPVVMSVRVILLLCPIVIQMFFLPTSNLQTFFKKNQSPVGEPHHPTCQRQYNTPHQPMKTQMRHPQRTTKTSVTRATQFIFRVHPRMSIRSSQDRRINSRRSRCSCQECG